MADENEELTAEDMATIQHEIVLGISAENSRLAPLTERQLAFRQEVEPQVKDIMARGGRIDLESYP